MTEHAVCSSPCPTCGVHALGVDPGFDVRVACMLVPCSLSAMRTHLKRHKDEFPARYRRVGSHRRVRVLYASEVKRIRQSMLWGAV